METALEPMEVPEPPRPQVEPEPHLSRAVARATTDDVRASFEAVRAARESVRMRLRRDTRRVRALTAVCLAAIGAGAFTLVKQRRAAHGPVAAPVAADAPPLQEAAAPRPTEPAGANMAPSPAAAPAPAGPTGVAETPATATADSSAASLSACSAAYGRHRWRAAAEACISAFQASPQDASLAMKMAQVQHARGQYAAAGDW